MKTKSLNELFEDLGFSDLEIKSFKQIVTYVDKYSKGELTDIKKPLMNIVDSITIVEANNNDNK